MGIAVATAVLVAGLVPIYQAREDAWTQAERSSENLRLALQHDIVRNIGVLDLSLKGVIEALAQPEIDKVPIGIRREALFNSSLAAQNLGAVLVVDADGRIVEESDVVALTGVNVFDRDYFQVHRLRGDAGLFVSRPYASRTAMGDLRIGLSRRIPTPDGHFAGIVQASIRLPFFEHLFGGLDIGTGGTIALIRDDGRVLYRTPMRPGDIDRDVSATPNFLQFLKADHGQFVSRSAIDGVERLYTFGRLPGLPLILSVARESSDILRPWLERTVVTAPVLLLLFGAAVVVSILFGRELDHRCVAEIRARLAADRLAALAALDGLTGIPNRRAFDTALADVYGRTLGGAFSVALLMIDVDNFKAFNDSFGHQEGDKVLKRVASALSAVIHRREDLVARFGGEEFVALLPGTDLAGAAIVAERIRARIASLSFQLASGASTRVTISVGVAAVVPRVEDRGAGLIEAADRALYEAKRAGRDRVRTAPREAVSPAGAEAAAAMRVAALDQTRPERLSLSC